MAPIRRYLRISKYSVIECRIYLESPSDTRWLLSSRDPVLPRIIAAVRPLVLPKLREENERAMAKKKSKPVKDVIADDEFEVAIFLRESRTRHSLLTRHKTFSHTKDTLNKAGQAGLSGQSATSGSVNAEILVESDSEADLDQRNIPESATRQENDIDDQDDESPSDRQRTSKRKKVDEQSPEEVDVETGDDKKLRFRTNYESFNICGWVLCLLVTRRGEKTRPTTGASESARQLLMEEWISTQAQGNLDEE